MRIPFNHVEISSKTLQDICLSFNENEFENGSCSQQVISLLQEITSAKHVLLTSSCTAALEISALLFDFKPGDEILMPAFTFVSTANAFVLRSAKPVFVDINLDTLNLDLDEIKKKITPRTRAIVPVHYAGASAEIFEILRIAKEHNLVVIEDAAQCLGARDGVHHLGTLGHTGCLSFHYTKNIVAGFGGALLTNSESLFKKAKVIQQRGTNRDAFLNGEVDKYSWVALGSSYTMPESNAAILLNQLRMMEAIELKRLKIWNTYQDAFSNLEKMGLVKRPSYTKNQVINGHIYYLILSDFIDREDFIQQMKKKGIAVTSHYQPLHLSDYYMQYYTPPSLPRTEKVCNQIVRFPLFAALNDKQQEEVIEAASEYLMKAHKTSQYSLSKS